MTDWLHEVQTELRHREQVYRGRNHDDDSHGEEYEEYWRHVANGLSEALDVLEEAEHKRRSAGNGDDNND